MFIDATTFQIAFYIVSPIATFLAVGTAYLAIYRQSKPSIVIYYELSPDVQTVIDLVICNHGSGAARDIEFSTPLPINCWGIDSPQPIDSSKFMDSKIPVLAPGKELRYQAGQYKGLISKINDGFSVTAKYTYRTPLRTKKNGEDISILDLRYMKYMNTKSSAAHDLSDALRGKNNTIFLKINRSLESIDKKLGLIASSSTATDETE